MASILTKAPRVAENLTTIRLRPMRFCDAQNLLRYINEQGEQGYQTDGAHGLIEAVQRVLDDVEARLARPAPIEVQNG